jgi:hypothetical protein
MSTKQELATRSWTRKSRLLLPPLKSVTKQTVSTWTVRRRISPPTLLDEPSRKSA